jgi:hypothetical protein
MLATMTMHRCSCSATGRDCFNLCRRCIWLAGNGRTCDFVHVRATRTDTSALNLIICENMKGSALRASQCNVIPFADPVLFGDCLRASFVEFRYQWTFVEEQVCMPSTVPWCILLNTFYRHAKPHKAMNDTLTLHRALYMHALQTSMKLWCNTIVALLASCIALKRLLLCHPIGGLHLPLSRGQEEYIFITVLRQTSAENITANVKVR